MYFVYYAKKKVKLVIPETSARKVRLIIDSNTACLPFNVTQKTSSYSI